MTPPGVIFEDPVAAMEEVKKFLPPSVGASLEVPE